MTKADGTTEVWSTETVGPNGLRRLGLSDRRLFQVGETYKVDICPDRSGANLGFTNAFWFPDGKFVKVGFPESPNGEIRPTPTPQRLSHDVNAGDGSKREPSEEEAIMRQSLLILGTAALGDWRPPCDASGARSRAQTQPELQRHLWRAGVAETKATDVRQKKVDAFAQGKTIVQVGRVRGRRGNKGGPAGSPSSRIADPEPRAGQQARVQAAILGAGRMHDNYANAGGEV